MKKILLKNILLLTLKIFELMCLITVIAFGIYGLVNYLMK